MEVAIIINNLCFGGAEVQTVELANNLAGRGYKILLMSLGDNVQIKERISPEIEVVLLEKKIYLDFKALNKIIKKLKEFKPQTLLMVNSYSTMYGYLASFVTGRRFKMISINHTTLFKGFVDKLKNIIDPRIINRMDVIVFVCNNQKLHWIKKYGINPEKSIVVYNGIDLDRFMEFGIDKSSFREKLTISPSEIVIGINANLRPEKKHEDMIDALQILLGQGYNLKLLFIGDGVRRKQIEEYIKSKELVDKVIITGFVQDVRPYLACTDISVLTSVAVETLSIAIIESMAMGKPVVLSDIGGANELVEAGVNGFIYEAGKVHLLVEALKQVIDGKSFDAMGEKSAEKAKLNFSRNVMVEKYISLFKD